MLERCQNAQERSSSHLFSGQFSGTTINTSIDNTLLELLWSVDVPFGEFFKIASHLVVSPPKKKPRKCHEYSFSSQTGKNLR